MGRKIGLIHATPNSVIAMENAIDEFAPNVNYQNFIDKELLDAVNREGKVTGKLVRRIIKLIEKAEESGVDGVALSCSSFTPFVPQIESLFDFPVVSVDMAMLEKAVTIGEKIGVIATVAAAGPTTTKLIKEIANNKQKEIEIVTETIIEASEAMKNGDSQRHDMLIQEKIHELAKVCDVIVIAQLSMVRALGSVGEISVPILSSGETAIKSLLSKLQHLETT
ncbi:aspartate/glutamate racemase family protein [Metabacillus endolithicus]|uniref:Aspartate/glutamate racemase family protein n=1 Tax=Metabacillus endolithicus TaxID=1535204 RepID=A0ABW5C394_9BACI|nr:aspartate/glutamate racemase family protein [Metabacillus endolithicus]UPG62513.1 aspartate/glutamate racemase family protein [Metabacillus endolithicus]